MIREFFHFEAGRVFGDRRVLGIGLLIFIIAGFLAATGVRNHAQFLEEERTFQEYEKQRVPQYVNYAQYAALGFRVMFKPSPLAVFFEGSRLMSSLESNVDLSELIQIYNVHKGRSLFSVRGYFSDIFGFLFVIGTLVMVYSGTNAFPSRSALALRLQFMDYPLMFWGTLITRFLILSLVFNLPLIGMYAYTQMMGIEFSGREPVHLLAVFVLLWTMLAFFFVLGVVLRGLFRFRGQSLLWTFVVWFALVFLVPEMIMEFVYSRSQNLPSNDSLNFQKLRVVLENEARAVDHVRSMSQRKDVDMREVVREQLRFFLDNIHLLNRNIELDLTRRVHKLIRQYERISLLVPTQFYVFVNREISGLGYYGYLDFKQHILHIQERFLRFFFQQHYFHRAEKVESFIRPGENVYASRSYLSEMFKWGLGLVILYTILMSVWAQRRYQRLVREP